MDIAVCQGRFGVISESAFFDLISEEAERKSVTMKQHRGMPWSTLGVAAGIMVKLKTADESDFVPNLRNKHLWKKFRPLSTETLPRLIFDLINWKCVKVTKLKEVQSFRAKLHALAFAALVSGGQLAAAYMKDWLKSEGFWLDMELQDQRS